MFHDWKKYNTGLSPRELTRVMNGKYNPPIDSEYAKRGYTPSEYFEMLAEYCRQNEKKIEHRMKRSEALKENAAKAKARIQEDKEVA